jgi:uncharacterized protein
VKWQVMVNGQDMTSRMRPYLIEISVIDKAGTSSDSCSLTFDDTDGKISLPPVGSDVTVSINGILKFKGVSESPKSKGSRSGGRTITMSAKGFDTRGKGKQVQQLHKDDATLDDFLSAAARNAGFDIKVAPELGALKRDYWSADGESFIALGERLAREFNATFKLRGKQAVFAQRGATDLPAVTAKVGEGGNVISWDITPVTGRERFSKARTRWFSADKGEFEETETGFDIDDGDADADLVPRSLAADETDAKSDGKARKGHAERKAGEGTIEMDLALDAQAEAEVALSGARPGVDGTYTIDTVTTKANRNGGSTTSLAVKKPGGGAGKDTRKKKGATSSEDNLQLPAVPGLS